MDNGVRGLSAGSVISAICCTLHLYCTGSSIGPHWASPLHRRKKHKTSRKLEHGKFGNRSSTSPREKEEEPGKGGGRAREQHQEEGGRSRPLLEDDASVMLQSVGG